MTKELYLEDPYLGEFTARVLHNSGREVILDQTALYPGGSGQPPDKGELNVGPISAKIIEVRRTEMEDDFDDDFDESDEDFDDESDGVQAAEQDIVHVLDRALPKTVREVNVSVDWPRRYRNMRYSTALALLCAACVRELGATVSGGRIRSGRARLDLKSTSVTVDDAGVRRVESAVNQEIENNSMKGMLEESRPGGLYLREASEVGGISVSRWMDRGSRGVRLEFTLIETGAGAE